MTARRFVAALVAATVFYLGLIGWRGLLLVAQDGWTARGLGAGVLLLPIIGVAVIMRELRFGRDVERLGRRLGEAAGIDVADSWAADTGPELPRRPSGRMDRGAADALFARRRAEVEQSPDDWCRWYRLAVAYGDAGDSRRGRVAMRHAIELERAAAGAGQPIRGLLTKEN